VLIDKKGKTMKTETYMAVSTKLNTGKEQRISIALDKQGFVELMGGMISQIAFWKPTTKLKTISFTAIPVA
jgi:hypothetical protein